MGRGLIYIFFILLVMYTGWECMRLDEDRLKESIRALSVLLVVAMILTALGILDW